MSEDIRQMIDKVKNFKQFVNKDVGFVFQQHPELANVGTPEQYSKYLETIFPNSKIKDIVYHSSHNKIENFRDNMFGIYFSYSPIQGGGYGNIINSGLINVENPLIKPKPEDSIETKELYNKDLRTYNNPSSFSSDGIGAYKYDASIESSTVTKEGVQIKVRNQEQIHILGSKDDVTKFKEFVYAKEDQIK